MVQEIQYTEANEIYNRIKVKLLKSYSD